MNTTEEKLITIIKSQQEEIRRNRDRLSELNNIFHCINESRSWKITKPLRRLTAFLQNRPVFQISPKKPPAGHNDLIDIAQLEKILSQQIDEKKIEHRKENDADFPHIQVSPEVLQRDTILDFFVFPIISWEFRFQRPQQIATYLAKNQHRIFYFETTFNNSQGEPGINDISVEQISCNIYVVKLAARKPVNIYRGLIHGKIEMLDILRSILLLRRTFAITHSVSIIDHPFWWPIARALKNNRNIYDCMDDHSGFDTNENISVYEPALIADSDMVVVSSDKLHENVKPIAKNAIMVRNGTDFSHFNNLPDSDLLSDLVGPIIGYYGAIAEWFDVPLIEACIKKYPSFQFVLIGRITNNDLYKLQDYDNVHLLGEIKYLELPKYVKRFDVCLIPFIMSKLIEATNPVKFYEYISSGKPVISVMLPELIPYREICYLSDNQDEFIKNIEIALNESNMYDKRVEVARMNSWDHRGRDFYKGILKMYPSVSIIVVTYNNLNYTRLCYHSIKKYSRYPNYEIIFVDNNSIDDTVAWLKKTKENDSTVQIILNKDNLGFAAANNLGLEAAKGEFIVYLNNDTVVTNNWIEGMLSHMIENPSIGLLCTATNETGNEACVRIDYSEVSSIQSFANEFFETNKGMHRRIRTAPLYCAMSSAKILKSINGLNEEYAKGMFEDDELSERIRALGLFVCYTEDVFIHHFGRTSFKKLPTDEYKQLFAGNKQIFEKKWGKYIPHIRGWFNSPVNFPDEYQQ